MLLRLASILLVTDIHIAAAASDQPEWQGLGSSGGDGQQPETRGLGVQKTKDG